MNDDRLLSSNGLKISNEVMGKDHIEGWTRDHQKTNEINE